MACWNKISLVSPYLNNVWSGVSEEPVRVCVSGSVGSLHISVVGVWFLCKMVNALLPSLQLLATVYFFASGDIVDLRTLLSWPRCVYRFQFPDSPGSSSGLKNLRRIPLMESSWWRRWLLAAVLLFLVWVVLINHNSLVQRRSIGGTIPGSDRHSYGASRESRRHDDYRRYHDKRPDDNDRSHSDRSHGDWRNVNSRYGGKSVKGEHRTRNQEKHGPPREYPRHDGTEYDKDADLRKETNSTRRHPEEKESKNREKFKQEEALKKRSGKEIEKSSCAAEPELETREKRRSLFSSVGPGVENAQHMEMDTSGGIKDETMNDLNAAKAAAMKAAKSVKKNILGFGVGTGRLSTDQKKKLLWGNKKSNPPETSTHWDSNLFSDRERQEKFNKLMGVKSSASASVQENKAVNKGEGPAEVKKQEELDTDLEKLYVAGLRRRDGRTVGLGL